MMPLKIEISENAGSGYDVTVLGIGETGRKAIWKYPSLYVPIPFKKEKDGKWKGKGIFLNLHFYCFQPMKNSEVFSLFFHAISFFAKEEEKETGVQFIFSFLSDSLDFHSLWKRVENEIEFFLPQ